MSCIKLPQAVVFDLGKVLIDFDYSIAVNLLAARCTCSAEALDKLVGVSPLLVQYESGAISTDKFFAQVKSVSGFQGDLTEFKGFFYDVFTPIPSMIQLYGELRQKGVPVFIFSNTNELATEQICRQFEFFNSSDRHILSFEHGALKPDPRLYEVVERRAGLSGSDLLYVDDRPENVATGLARGWQAFVHESPSKTWSIIGEAGLLK